MTQKKHPATNRTKWTLRASFALLFAGVGLGYAQARGTVGVSCGNDQTATNEAHRRCYRASDELTARIGRLERGAGEQVMGW